MPRRRFPPIHIACNNVKMCELRTACAKSMNAGGFHKGSQSTPAKNRVLALIEGQKYQIRGFWRSIRATDPNPNDNFSQYEDWTF